MAGGERISARRARGRNHPATVRDPLLQCAAVARRYWLLKTEPQTFSFDDLLRAPARTTGWNGVRIYHSSADPPAVVGEAEVAREGYPDPTQFDRKDDHFDPESAPDEPRWYQ